MEYSELLYKNWGIKSKTLDFISECELSAADSYSRINEVCEYNQAKVLHAFQMEGVGARHFAPSTGYGYDDIGRDSLDRVFANALGYEDAIVRAHLASGTHAIALALFSVLMPGDEMLSISGKPYDTLEEAIGIRGNAYGSLKQYGVSYSQIELIKEGIDVDAALRAINAKTKVAYIQRSRGYAWRDALSVEQINRAISAIKKISPDIVVIIDNCYGEFTERKEPNGDLVVGSMIKNPGGGLAPAGGYIAGKASLIEKVANKMTSPGIGREVGSYADGYGRFFQGLFMAPHVVGECLKGAELCARVYSKLGYEVLPKPGSHRSDIIQAIRFNNEKYLVDFCRSIQSNSPVDSNVTPEPWNMPGYENKVIMAAGAFVQGASIELSADAPIIEPYIAFMQGGLTYQHVKLALTNCINNIM